MRPLPLDPNLFDGLASQNGENLISIFIPVHSKGPDVAQDRIRFKNQLSMVESELENRGWKPRDRQRHLRKAELLLDDHEFWQNQQQGLAVYIDDGGDVTPISLSQPVKEWSIVMPVYLMRLLLLELKVPEVPVLGLTRGEVGLFHTSARTTERADVDLPKSFDDVNWFVDRERQRQQHPDSTHSGRARHGHDPSAQEGEDLNRFLREVDGALPAGDPIVVLGDDDLVARFASLSGRRVLSPKNSGLRSPFTEQEIRDEARPFLDQLRGDREQEAIDMAERQIGTGNATTDVAVAMPGAITGRIGHVVVDPAIDPVWGRVDEATLDVTVHDERAYADVDLVDRIVVLAMRNGAEVTPVSEQNTGHPLVAVTRF